MSIYHYPVDIIINSKPVTKFLHENKTYIEGRPGSKYSIQVKNPTSTRVKAVISVDGLSILDGKPAGKESQGYIIEAFGTLDIEGWRTSSSTVGAFEFGSRKDSYANKSGEGATNVGVIGVMIFQEDYNHHGYVKALYRSYQSPVFGSAGDVTFNATYSTCDSSDTVLASAALCNNLGTGMGEDVLSHSTEVKFKAFNYPIQTSVIYYDDRKGLEARGIVVDPRKMHPDPFPASNAYCKRV